MLTPLDIENKKFSKQMMNGYNVEEVDDFLDEIGIDYAKKQKEAQSTAEEVKNVAKQKADQIINDAKSLTQKESDFLQTQIVNKKKELEDIQKQFDIYKAKMESLLISQLELIKEINKNDNEII